MRGQPSAFSKARHCPEHLIQQAAHLEMPAMALLDRNGFYGAVRFHMEGKKLGVRSHICARTSERKLR